MRNRIEEERVDQIWQRVREGKYWPGDIVWLLEQLRKAQSRAERASNASRDVYEAGCDHTEAALDPRDCLNRLAEITKHAAWPLSLLSWLIRETDRGQPYTRTSQ